MQGFDRILDDFYSIKDTTLQPFHLVISSIWNYIFYALSMLSCQRVVEGSAYVWMSRLNDGEEVLYKV